MEWEWQRGGKDPGGLVPEAVPLPRGHPTNGPGEPGGQAPGPPQSQLSVCGGRSVRVCHVWAKGPPGEREDTEAGTLGLREQPGREGEPRSCTACQALLQSRLPQPWTPNESRASRGLGRLRGSSTGRPRARRLPPQRVGTATRLPSLRSSRSGKAEGRATPTPAQKRGTRGLSNSWFGRAGEGRGGQGRCLRGP